MKIKVSLLFTQYNSMLKITDYNHIAIFFNDDLKFPSCYLGNKDPYEALENIYFENFRVDKSWFLPKVSDFRKTDQLDYEIVYTSSRPLIPNMNKAGHFYTMYEIQSKNIEIDPYYEQLIRSNNFLII